jgi:hypothetical protein
MLLPRPALRLLPTVARRVPFSTLTPSKLAPSDWIDLSEKSNCRVKYESSGAPIHGVLGFRHGGVLTRHGGGVPPFPPGTAGFLYAHTVPGHPAAGEVRMRLVPSPDPGLFAAGADLRMPNGLPWTRPFPALARAKTLPPVRECLLREGAMSAGDAARWADLRVEAHSRIVHAAGAPFFFNFREGADLRMRVAHGSEVELVVLKYFASVQVSRVVPLWTGVYSCLTYSRDGAKSDLLYRLRTPRVRVPARRTRVRRTCPAHHPSHRPESYRSSGAA